MNLLNIIPVILGSLMKIGDEMLNRYKFKPGEFYSELIKVSITTIFVIFLTKSNNIWIYYYTFFATAISTLFAPDGYLSNNYIFSLNIVLSIISFYYLAKNRKLFKVPSLFLAGVLAIVVSFPFVIQDVAPFWLSFFNIKSEKWVQELGAHKLVIRGSAIVIAIFMLIFVNKFDLTKHFTQTKFTKGFNTLVFMMLGYYVIGVITQTYRMYFSEKDSEKI